MSIARTCRVVTVLFALSFVLGGTATAKTPEGVSPGAIDRAIEVEARCPTFSWGLVPDAEHYDIVAYRLPEWMRPEELDLSLAEEVLLTRIPGQATSWTPDLNRCLSPGESYIWFARAVFGDDHEESDRTDGWSDGRFFSISAVPTAREVEEALDALRRYVAAGNDADPRRFAGSGLKESEVAEQGEAGLLPQPSPDGAKSVSSAPAAITGHVSGSSGERYGAVGISDSASGAGLAAANTTGGPDLVLDGGGLPNAHLSESGIDRPSSTGQSFNIRNSASGSMTLQVDGQAVGMISQINAGSGLTGGGSSGTVGVSIGTGAVTAAHLGTDSVASSEIVNGSITYADTNVNSVQRRVTSSCPAGQAIRSISSTGTVTCEADNSTSITRHGPYYAGVTNGGTDVEIWAYSTSTNVCFLSEVHLRDVDGSGEDAWCLVGVDSLNRWYLEAHTDTGDDADAWCTMYCLDWNY